MGVRILDKLWFIRRTNDEVLWLLAPDLETATWKAAEMSGGTDQIKDVILDEYG